MTPHECTLGRWVRGKRDYLACIRLHGGRKLSELRTHIQRAIRRVRGDRQQGAKCCNQSRNRHRALRNKMERNIAATRALRRRLAT